MTLNEINPGDECRVVNVLLAGETGQRLLDMGFVPGAQIKVIRNAPLKDPIDISIKGYVLALRRSEAREIEVSLS